MFILESREIFIGDKQTDKDQIIARGFANHYAGGGGLKAVPKASQG
jgi:hypothetical protein